MGWCPGMKCRGWLRACGMSRATKQEDDGKRCSVKRGSYGPGGYGADWTIIIPHMVYHREVRKVKWDLFDEDFRREQV